MHGTCLWMSGWWGNNLEQHISAIVPKQSASTFQDGIFPLVHMIDDSICSFSFLCNSSKCCSQSSSQLNRLISHFMNILLQHHHPLLVSRLLYLLVDQHFLRFLGTQVTLYHHFLNRRLHNRACRNPIEACLRRQP